MRTRKSMKSGTPSTVLALLCLACPGLVGFVACPLPASAGGPPLSQAPPSPVGAQTNGELSATNLARGRQLYIAKCARCHKFHDPARYTNAEWKKWMTSMSKKSRLKPDQELLITRYLETFREAAKPGGLSIPSAGTSKP